MGDISKFWNVIRCHCYPLQKKIVHKVHKNRNLLISSLNVKGDLVENVILGIFTIRQNQSIIMENIDQQNCSYSIDRTQ